jgi:hypothetical protein
VTLAIGDGAGLGPRRVRRDRAHRVDAAAGRRLPAPAEAGRAGAAVVGDAPVMTARIRWVGAGSFTTTDRFETVIAPLQNAAAPARFAL